MQCHSYNIHALHARIGVGVATDWAHTSRRVPALLILCAQKRAVRGTHLGLSCTQTAPLLVRTEATLTDSTGHSHLQPTLLNNIAQEHAVRGTHLCLSFTQPSRYQSARRPQLLPIVFYNVAQEENCVGRIESLLHSPRNFTSLHAEHATILYESTHTYNPFFFNNIDQERAVRGTHLGLPCTQTAPLTVCTEATLPHSTVALTHTTHNF